MQSFKINPAHVMEAVYSYPFPEVRQLLGSRTLDPMFMMNTLPVAKAATYLGNYNFTPALQLPAQSDGTLDLDELHMPIITRLRARLNDMLPGLETFTTAYPTPGSSQAMFMVMAEWKAQGKLTSLAVLDGEYEGYAAYARSLNIPVTVYSSLEGNIPKAGEMWCISNPSAVDGNFIPDATWRAFVTAGHQIIYDAAYLGLTDIGRVDIRSPHIKAVLVSPSKVFGVFRYRHTGLCLTRQPVAALYGSKWFKDIPALLDTLQLYETFAAHELPRRYKKTQAFLCAELSKVVGCTVMPSDTLLLGYTKGPVNPAFAGYMRTDGVYRFGLTKLFEDHELLRE